MKDDSLPNVLTYLTTLRFITVRRMVCKFFRQYKQIAQLATSLPRSLPGVEARLC